MNKTSISTNSIYLFASYSWNLKTLDSIFIKSKFKKVKRCIDGGRTVHSSQRQESDINLVDTSEYLRRNLQGLGIESFVFIMPPVYIPILAK